VDSTGQRTKRLRLPFSDELVDLSLGELDGPAGSVAAVVVSRIERWERGG
jgi:hypothetical protein